MPKEVTESHLIKKRNGLELMLIIQQGIPIIKEASYYVNVLGKENNDETCFHPIDNHSIISILPDNDGRLVIPGLKENLLGVIGKEESLQQVAMESF